MEDVPNQLSGDGSDEDNVMFKGEAFYEISPDASTSKETTPMANAITDTKPSTVKGSTSSGIGEGSVASGAGGDGTKCITKLDPRSRAWILSAAERDYDALVKLLHEDPDLYRLKDFAWGYTALHWAAKFGSTEIVELIAGKYGLNPNVRSHGGYTPLHLAHMFEQREVAELLRAYGADENIRDHSGRKPIHYKKGGVPLPIRNPVADTSTSTLQASGDCHKGFGSGVLGSIRSKVKCAATALASPLSGHKLRSWSSADSVSDSSASTLGLQKSTPKKNKAKIPPFSFGSMDTMLSSLSLTSSPGTSAVPRHIEDVSDAAAGDSANA